MNLPELLVRYEEIETEAYRLINLVRVGRPLSPVVLRESWYELFQLIQMNNNLLREYIKDTGNII